MLARSGQAGALSRRYMFAVALIGGVAAVPAALGQDHPALSESVEPPGGQMTPIGAREEGPAVDQVATAGAEPVVPTQIYRDRPSAEPSTPLSRPAEGRDPTAAPLGGRDRCDDAKPAASKLCAQAIEKRAAEFEAPPSQSLSPEQRLLVDQRLRAAPRTVSNAAQRIGSSEIDANSSDAQSLASIVLTNPGETARPGPDKIDPRDAATADAAGAALIQAMVEGAQNNPR